MAFQILLHAQLRLYIDLPGQGELDSPTFRNFRVVEAQEWANVGGIGDSQAMAEIATELH